MSYEFNELMSLMSLVSLMSGQCANVRMCKCEND